MPIDLGLVQDCFLRKVSLFYFAHGNILAIDVFLELLKLGNMYNGEGGVW